MKLTNKERSALYDQAIRRLFERAVQDYIAADRVMTLAPWRPTC